MTRQTQAFVIFGSVALACASVVACSVPPTDIPGEEMWVNEQGWQPGPTHPDFATQEYATGYGVSNDSFEAAANRAREALLGPLRDALSDRITVWLPVPSPRREMLIVTLRRLVDADSLGGIVVSDQRTNAFEFYSFVALERLATFAALIDARDRAWGDVFERVAPLPDDPAERLRARLRGFDRAAMLCRDALLAELVQADDFPAPTQPLDAGMIDRGTPSAIAALARLDAWHAELWSTLKGLRVEAHGARQWLIPGQPVPIPWSIEIRGTPPSVPGAPFDDVPRETAPVAPDDRWPLWNFPLSIRVVTGDVDVLADVRTDVQGRATIDARVRAANPDGRVEVLVTLNTAAYAPRTAALLPEHRVRFTARVPIPRETVVRLAIAARLADSDTRSADDSDESDAADAVDTHAAFDVLARLLRSQHFAAVVDETSEAEATDRPVIDVRATFTIRDSPLERGGLRCRATARFTVSLRLPTGSGHTPFESQATFTARGVVERAPGADATLMTDEWIHGRAVRSAVSLATVHDRLTRAIARLFPKTR